MPSNQAVMSLLRVLREVVYNRHCFKRLSPLRDRASTRAEGDEDVGAAACCDPAPRVNVLAVRSSHQHAPRTPLSLHARRLRSSRYSGSCCLVRASPSSATKRSTTEQSRVTSAQLQYNNSVLHSTAMQRTRPSRSPPALLQLSVGLQQTYIRCVRRHEPRTRPTQQRQPPQQQHSKRYARPASVGDVPAAATTSLQQRISGGSRTTAISAGTSGGMRAAPSHSESARRILTKKTRPSGNNGLDNEDQNLIVSVRDVLGGREATPMQPEYIVLDMLGQGTFGQVFRCQNVETKEVVAIKVIRNHPSYYKQAIVEVQITRLLNASYREDEAPHLVRLLDTFEFRNHLCLIFELLSINLYELISENNFNGFPLTITRGFLQQMLHGLVQLEEIGVIHCDLKPENILLAGQDKFLSDVAYVGHHYSHAGANAAQTPYIKLVDFGSACQENETVYSYIQSRFYRSPEVLLGIPYTGAIDLWSLGCIAVEMFLGLPVFPGVSEHDQLRLIEETMGKLPQALLRQGRNVLKFYKTAEDHQFVLKTPAEFARDTNGEVKVSKKYFKYSKLEDMVHAYPYHKHATPAQLHREREQRDAFLHFVRGLLCVDPLARWSAREAKRHPFITGAEFVREEAEFAQSMARASPSTEDRKRSVVPLPSPPSLVRMMQPLSAKVRPAYEPRLPPAPPPPPPSHYQHSPWASPPSSAPTYALAYNESIWGPRGMPPYAAGPMPHPDNTRQVHRDRQISSKVAPAAQTQATEHVHRIAPYRESELLYSPPFRPLGATPQSLSSASDSYPVGPYDSYEGAPRYYMHAAVPPLPSADPATYRDEQSRQFDSPGSWGQEPIPRHHQYASTASQQPRRAKRQHTASWDSGDMRDHRRQLADHHHQQQQQQQQQPRYTASISSGGSGGSSRTDSTPRRTGKSTVAKPRKSPRRTSAAKQYTHHRHPGQEHGRAGHYAGGREDGAAPTCSVEEKFSSVIKIDVSTSAMPLPTT